MSLGTDTNKKAFGYYNDGVKGIYSVLAVKFLEVNTYKNISGLSLGKDQHRSFTITQLKVKSFYLK